MNEERIEMPTFSNVIPLHVHENDHRVITELVEPKVCPLCQGDLRLYFINFNDKMLMCKNPKCDYPFGIEEMKFFKENDSISVDTELDSQSSNTQGATTLHSILSEGYNNEISKLLNPIIEEDSQQFEPRALDVTEYLSTVKINKEPSEQVKKQEEITKKISELNKLHSEERQSTSKLIITNEAYVKNLIHMQKKFNSKVLLVNEQELEIANRIKEPGNNYKIDIETDAKEGSEHVIKVNFNINK